VGLRFRSVTDKKAVLSVIMDKMTESELCSIDEAHSIFDDFEPRPFAHVDILSKGKSESYQNIHSANLQDVADKYCESSQTNSWPVLRRQLSNRH
jgi:hypothetical protein